MQSSTVTLEEALVPGSPMEGRIREVTRSLPWLVLEDGGQIHGYAYATEWKSGSAYRYAVESTVYVAREFIGTGGARSSTRH